MAYTDHLQTVNDALHALLIGEFETDIKFESEFQPNWKRSEYIRYWPVSQIYVSGNTSGEDRQYTYDIDIYFNIKQMSRNVFKNTVSERLERLKQLLMENRTYQPSDVYKWHDGTVDEIEILKRDEEDDYEGIYYVHCEFTIMRFNQWA